VGLVGVLLTGLAWIGHLRSAIDAVWDREPDKPNFLVGKAANLMVLAGLGLGLVISIGLTVLGTTLTGQILDWTALDDVPGAGIVLKAAGLVLAGLGDVIIFAWLLIRLPFLDVPISIGFRGALRAAIGFEVLKVLGSVTIARSAQSPTAGPFAGVLAVLIWIQLVARFMLFCAAWMATLTYEHAERDRQRKISLGRLPGPDAVPLSQYRRPRPEPALSPAAVGAGLVGVGAVAGAAAAHWISSRWPAPRRERN
jgi:membrane protein